MADLQPTDEFLVNRADTTYTQEQGTLMANLESDDLLLINRSDVAYTITGEDLVASVIDPLEVNVTLAPLPPIVNQSVTATAFAIGGKAPDGGYVFSYVWTLADDAAGTGAVNQAETTNIYTLPGNSEGKFVKCEATTTDGLGTTESGDSGYVEIEVTAAAPDIASVLLTEVGSADGRFTNNEFPFVTTMAVDGEPAPTYEAKARVFGATYNVAVKSDVITDVEDVDAAWKNLNLNNEGWYDIAASDTTFVIVAYNEGPNRIKYSNDKGLTWEDATGFDATKVYRAVNYIPEVSRFFASWEGTPGGLYWSDDGASWTACTGLTIGSLGEVLYDSNTNAVIFATGGSTYGVYTSSDSGESFTAVSSNFADYATSLMCVAYNPANSTLLIGTVGGMLRSTDSGATWAKETTFNYSDVIWDSVNNIFAAVCMNPGKGIVRFDAQGQFIGAIDVGNNRDGGICIDNSDYKLVCSRGSNAAWHYSTDAQNWTEVQDYPTGGEYRRIAAIDNIFIAVSYSGTQRVVRSEGGVGGSLTTLTFATASNLDKFNAGADVKMTDAAGNDATYQPVTSQITGVDSFVCVLETASPGASDWSNASPGTGNAAYTQTFTGFQPVSSFTASTGGVSYVFDFGKIVSWTFDKGPTANPTFYASNDNNTYTYCGNTDAGGKLTSDGVATYSAAINGSNFSGTSRYAVVYSGSTGYKLPGAFELVLILTNDTDLKYFQPGDMVQAPDVKVISTDLDANTMTVDGGYWSDGPITAPDSTNDVVVGSNVISTHYDYDNSGGSALSHGYFAYTNSNGDLDNTTITIKTGTAGTLKLSFAFTLANADKSSLPASGTNCTAAWTDDAASVDTGYGVYNLELTCTGAATYEFTLTDPPLTSPVIAYLYTGAMNSTSTPTWQGNTLYAPAGWSDAPNKLYVQSTLGDSEVTGPALGATGKFGGATGNTATVTDVTGRWVANDNGKGEQFFMEPTVPQIDTLTEMFCNLEIESNKAVVKSLSESDPGFLPITDKDYSVKFNSQLASGEAPDDALPNGTQIEVTVKATNAIGSDEETSNAVTPTVPNPEGSAGPITGVEETTVELWNQDAVWSNGGTYTGVYYAGTIENIFNGSLTTWLGGRPINPTGFKILFSGLPAGTSGNQRIMVLSEGGTLTIKTNDNGTEKTHSEPISWTGTGTWKDVPLDGSITEVYFHSDPNNSSSCYIYGIEVDGKLLVDTGVAGAPTQEVTKLTVASPSNLDTFVVDDTVKMVDADGAVASYAPVTSQITGVDSVNYDLGSETWNNSGSVGYEWDKAFNGSFSVPGANGSGAGGSGVAGAWYGVNFQSVPTKSGDVIKLWSNAQGASCAFSYVSYDNFADYITNGMTWTNDKSPGGNVQGYWAFTATQKVVGLAVEGTPQVLAVSVNDEFIVNGDQIVTLTLTDEQDLKYLKAGDTVKGESATGTYGTETAAFSTTLYTGTESPQSINTGIDNTVKSLVWQKARNQSNSHNLWDSFRDFKILNSNSTSPSYGAGTNSQPVFTADGFDLVANVGDTANYSGYDYATWNFRAAPGFFDIVTYEGDGVAGREMPHSLGTKPGMFIVKRTSDADDWSVYHQSIGATDYLRLNSTNAKSTSSVYWNDTEPTDEVFTLGNQRRVNSLGSEYVAYLFADTPGKIKCGSYDGTGGAHTIDCGFKPGFVITKATKNISGGSQSSDWYVMDSKRPGKALYANNTINDQNVAITYESNGFGVDGGAFALNENGNTYIYVAIAEDVTAGNFPPTGTLTADADDSGPTITLTDVTGTWEDGMEAIGPAKSGEGTFVSTNGTNEMVLKDSNNQWIDNQNRLGTNFYVKEMNAFLKAGDARDEAEYQAIADAFAAYPGKVEERETAISTLVAEVAATLSNDEATLLYEIVDIEQPD